MLKKEINTSLERVPITVYSSQTDAVREIAQRIGSLIKLKQAKGELAVLGLATGASPIPVYKELIKLHKEDGLSFHNVVSFNLDEYYPSKKENVLSYNYFMNTHLFNHVNVRRENIHIPDGELPISEVTSFCHSYEELIDYYGGIDIQLLGIGRSGHVGFNEPPSVENTQTRLVKLHPITIADAKREFVYESAVPRRAITMGIQSILSAREIILMAWGESKAEVIRRLAEDGVSESFPASYIQKHANASVHIDRAAGSQLSRFKTPWRVAICEWDEEMAYKAVLWLGTYLQKPILKLTEQDYQKNDLEDLILNFGDVQELNVKMFHRLQNTITGWPGGKPNSDDQRRPERALPRVKRSVIFSPHPDDDVISMGGTLQKLVDQGHEVHVVYQTSGNIAVRDDDVHQYLRFLSDFGKEKGVDFSKALNSIFSKLQEKKETDLDSQEVRDVKRLIRKEEAWSAARFCGVHEDRIHFLNLPFYETGKAEKLPISVEDINLTTAILTSIKPHQIFAAGDLRDPHGTHEVCLNIIRRSLDDIKSSKKQNWIKDCYLWLYRGAWHEWPIEQIQMAVPLSPADLLKKRQAIFRHQSQKDTPVFPGSDSREFWQRAEERNQLTAKMYDQLGLAEYEAIEAFLRFSF